MKIPSTLVLLLACLSFAYAADPPTEDQARFAMDAKIRKQSNGLLRMGYFEKTNGQKAIVNGVEVYTMDCSTQVIANEDCAMTGFSLTGWDGSFAAVPAQKNATTLDKFNPSGGAYGGNKQLRKGGQQRFTTQLTFDLTERGWRCEGMLPPALPDDKKIKELLVGEWKDEQHTEILSADGTWTRDGKKLGKWEYGAMGLALFDDTTRNMWPHSVLTIDSSRLVIVRPLGEGRRTLERVRK